MSVSFNRSTQPGRLGPEIVDALSDIWSHHRDQQVGPGYTGFATPGILVQRPDGTADLMAEVITDISPEKLEALPLHEFFDGSLLTAMSTVAGALEQRSAMYRGLTQSDFDPDVFADRLRTRWLNQRAWVGKSAVRFYRAELGEQGPVSAELVRRPADLVIAYTQRAVELPATVVDLSSRTDVA